MHGRSRSLTWMSGFVFSIGLFLCNTIEAIEVDPGDFVSVPDGTNLIVMYNQFSNFNSFYKDGKKLPGDPGLRTNVNILRLVRFMEVGGVTIDPQILLPFGRLDGTRDNANLGGEGGTGDLLLTAGAWLVNEPAKGNYVVFIPYLFLPTGSYDKRSALNLGENRYKLNLQLGSTFAVGTKYQADLLGDVTFYSDNDEYGPSEQRLEQAPLYQFGGKLSRILNEHWKLAVGLTYTYGGEQSVADVDLENEKNDWRFETGVVFNATPRHQIIALYRRDFRIENGFGLDHGLFLRFMYAF